LRWFLGLRFRSRQINICVVAGNRSLGDLVSYCPEVEGRVRICAVPLGLDQLAPYPALTRWASECRSSGACLWCVPGGVSLADGFFSYVSMAVFPWRMSSFRMSPCRVVSLADVSTLLSRLSLSQMSRSRRG